MVCFILASDEPRLGTLRGWAEALGYRTRVVPDLAALRADSGFAEAARPLVLVPGEANAEAVIRLAGEAKGHAFAVLVAETLAPAIYKRLVRTGAAEWISWDSGPAELGEIASHLAAPSGAPERGAKVVSFLPSRGGVGTTTLVVETGFHLASRRAGGRVALLDLNFGGGTLADALDLEPRLDVGEIAERPERLDEQLVDVFTSRHSPRLDVFAAPIREVAPDALPAPAVFALIDAIARRYGIVLIDLPPGWPGFLDNLLQGSDAVVAVGGSTVPGLRHLAARLARLDGLGLRADKLAAVVNPCEADVFGRVRRRREIERALPGRRLFCVRRDVAAAAGAQDAGRALLELSPGARVSRDVRRLAAWVATAVAAS